MLNRMNTIIMEYSPGTGLGNLKAIIDIECTAKFAFRYVIYSRHQETILQGDWETATQAQ